MLIEFYDPIKVTNYYVKSRATIPMEWIKWLFFV